MIKPTVEILKSNKKLLCNIIKDNFQLYQVCKTLYKVVGFSLKLKLMAM